MSEPIRVLHILQRMEAGGTQALLMNMYRNIDRSKVQFDFLVHYKENQFYDEEIPKLGGRLYKLSVREDFNFIKYWRELNKFFNEHKEYQIVHGHMYTLGVIYLLAAKRNGVQVRIAHAHDNDTERNMKYYLKRVMARLFRLYATDLFACSEEAGEYLFPHQEFKVLKNAINTESFIYSERSNIEIRKELNLNDQFVIGHVGRFQQQKNHSFLIDIFREIKKIKNDAILLLIGTGDLEDNIKERVSRYHLTDSVRFLGNRKDMARLYHSMDVFLFPSLFEGLGIVAIEAQASGIPSICSNRLPDEVKLTPLIELVSLEDSAELWAKKVIEKSQSHYKRNNMYDFIVNAGFDMKTVAQEMEQYYLFKNM